jgi:hypothetical protein
MGLDDEYRIDIDELVRQVESAEVLCIYFPMLRRTLILDSRSGDLDAPMVVLAPMVANAEERLKALHEMRPRLGQPEALVMAPWPRRIESLESAGVLEKIVRHFKGIGAPEAASRAVQAYSTLLAAERDEVRAAIVGENYQTYWSRA